MRRSDKEITDKAAMDAIIRRCRVCHLGLSNRDRPYVVPLSFGYDGSNVYFHTAQEGKKVDYIAANANACFEFECDVSVIPHDSVACRWGFSFQSVIGYGTVSEIVGRDEKRRGLDCIMGHYSDGKWDYSDRELAKVRVWRISIDSMSGKASG